MSKFNGAKEFCDYNCNNCEAIRNPQLSLLMNVLYNIFGEDDIGITNTVCPNMTCCGDCHIDDMCHYGSDDDFKTEGGEESDETCRIEKEAIRIADWYKKVNMKGRVNGKMVTLV